MIFECGAIIAVVVVMAYFMLRSGMSGYAIGVLPLALVPAFYIISDSLTIFLLRYFNWSYVNIRISIILFALVVSCLLIGGVSLGIKNTTKRLFFLVMCGLFSIILTTLLIINMLY